MAHESTDRSDLPGAPSLEAVCECVPFSAAAVLDAEGRHLIIGGSLWAELGIDPKTELRGHRIRDVFPPATAEALHTILGPALEGETSEGLVPHGGRTYEVVMSPIRAGEPEGPRVLLFARDVTEQVEREHLFTELVGSVPAGVHATGADGLTSVWNPAAERIFGIGRADAMGMTTAEILDELGVPEEADIRRAIQDDVPWEGDLAVVRPDGQPRVVSLTRRSLTDEHSEGVRGIGIAIDVTDERAEQRVAERRRRLEAIGRVAGGIAHDFGNLLTAVLGRVDFLIESVDDAGVRAEIDAITEALDTAAELTSRLLTVGSGAAGPGTCSAVEVAERVESLMQPLLPAGIRIHVDADAESHVPLRASDLEQVLLNLVSNATDAMPDGGRIGIDVRERGDHVVLTVSDEGGGIPLEVRHDLFDPFVSTKDASEGTGLGLATVHSIVSAGRGSVGVLETGPRGTVMMVRLPAVDASEESAAGGHVVDGGEAPDEVEAARILLVENEARVRSFVRRVLERDGHDVMEVHSVAEAEEILSARDDVELVLLSRSSRDPSERHHPSADHTVTIAKPFGVDDLRGTVAQALRRRRA